MGPVDRWTARAGCHFVIRYFCCRRKILFDRVASRVATYSKKKSGQSVDRGWQMSVVRYLILLELKNGRPVSAFLIYHGVPTYVWMHRKAATNKEVGYFFTNKLIDSTLYLKLFQLTSWLFVRLNNFLIQRVQRGISETRDTRQIQNLLFPHRFFP